MSTPVGRTSMRTDDEVHVTFIVGIMVGALATVVLTLLWDIATSPSFDSEPREVVAARFKAELARQRPISQTTPSLGHVLVHVGGTRKPLGSFVSTQLQGQAWCQWIDNKGLKHRMVQNLEFVDP